MTFFGVDYGFISDVAIQQRFYLIVSPILFLTAQFIIYLNLHEIQNSYPIKWYSFINRWHSQVNSDIKYKFEIKYTPKTIGILFPILLYAWWIFYVCALAFFPEIISLLVLALILMCILPLLNIITVRKLNKKLFLKKLSN